MIHNNLSILLCKMKGIDSVIYSGLLDELEYETVVMTAAFHFTARIISIRVP